MSGFIITAIPVSISSGRSISGSVFGTICIPRVTKNNALKKVVSDFIFSTTSSE